MCLAENLSASRAAARLGQALGQAPARPSLTALTAASIRVLRPSGSSPLAGRFTGHAFDYTAYDESLS